MSEACYVFAGGGTGGHLYPGLATANALRKLDGGARIVFMTTDRPLDAQLIGPTGYQQIEQAVRPATLHPGRVLGFLHSWFASVRAARAALAELRPRAVLGLGGYAAGPPVEAARKLGIRTALLNPDAVPGRANRFLARKVDRIFMQWEASRRYFSDSTRCEVVGCPIRGEFALAEREAGCAHFGLDAERPVLLVTGASQGARTINRAMQRVWPAFSREHPEWQLLHLTGAADERETREAYLCGARRASEADGVEKADASSGLRPTRGSAATLGSVRVVAFTHEMWLAVAAADVVISRAGASTLAELSAVGRPAILLPYPYARDRHQHANARVMADAGGAIVLEDLLAPERNHDPILDALSRLSNSDRRQEMAAAAKTIGDPNASGRVAAWMVG